MTILTDAVFSNTSHWRYVLFWQFSLTLCFSDTSHWSYVSSDTSHWCYVLFWHFSLTLCFVLTVLNGVVFFISNAGVTYSFFPPEKWVYTSFSPRKISIYSFFPPERSVYTHLSPWFLGGEIWVYTEVSPSYSILPLCTDRLCKGNNSYKGSTLWRLL